MRSKPAKIQRKLKICILMDMIRAARRDKLSGILKYESLFGPFQLWVPNLEDFSLEKHSFTDCDGIIVDRALGDLAEEALRELSQPTVILDYQGKIEQLPASCCGIVETDNEADGLMGAEFFLERRFQHFGFVNENPRVLYSEIRQTAFEARLKQEGFSCEVYSVSKTAKTPASDLERLKRWLKKIPKPAGILCASDSRAHQALQACAQAGISVPQEVAMLGIDDDASVCQLCSPPLSSIVNDNQQGGYLAAELLIKRLSNPQSQPGFSQLRYPPKYIHQRKSTATYVNAAQFVQEALDFIELNNGIGISVDDVSKRVHVSRRRLEVSFRRATGKTVLEQIHEIRFNRICKLLRETTLKVSEIAQLCGYQSEFYIYSAFKRRMGMTILQYRRK